MDASMEVIAEDRELVEKLAKLQDLHHQINELRGLLPERLLRPTRSALENPRGVSPEKLAANLRKAAIDGSRDIQRFKKDFQSQDMRELWQKTSGAEFTQGRDSWTVDYQALVRGSSFNQSASDIRIGATTTTDELPPEDEEAVLQKYQQTKPNLKITRLSQTELFPLAVSVSGISFRVIQQERDNKQILIVELNAPAAANTQLANEVMNHINERKDLSRLDVLLSMLASYVDLQFRACDRCKDVFDNQMKYPLLRCQRKLKDNDDKSTEWEVLHDTCIV